MHYIRTSQTSQSGPPNNASINLRQYRNPVKDTILKNSDLWSTKLSEKAERDRKNNSKYGGTGSDCKVTSSNLRDTCWRKWFQATGAVLD